MEASPTGHDTHDEEKSDDLNANLSMCQPWVRDCRGCECSAMEVSVCSNSCHMYGNWMLYSVLLLLLFAVAAAAVSCFAWQPMAANSCKLDV